MCHVRVCLICTNIYAGRHTGIDIQNDYQITRKRNLFVIFCSFFGYKHIGKLCYLDRNGKMHTGKVKWWTVFSNWVLGQFHRIGDGLRDHSIGEYYQILKNQK